jgi:hypothetical protein
LNSEHNQSKRHRGSSPPFQELESDFPEWMKDLKSIDQEYGNTSETQIQMQQQHQKENSTGQHDTVPQQNKDNEASWQDDGGESG